LPEALTARREDLYLGFFYRNWGGRPDAIPEDTQREYLRTYRLPGAMRAGFNLYRATSLDVVDNEAFRTAGSLEMPVLCQGGALGRGRGWPLSNPSAELPATCAAAGSQNAFSPLIMLSFPSGLASPLLRRAGTVF
jgi:hypothetical protein